MMVGEIEYSQVWMDQIKDNHIIYPKSITALIMIVVFIVLMPIVVMNLMVSLSNIRGCLRCVTGNYYSLFNVEPKR